MVNDQIGHRGRGGNRAGRRPGSSLIHGRFGDVVEVGIDVLDAR